MLSVIFLQNTTPAQIKEIRRVLILNDLGVISSPGFAEIDRAISDTLQESPYQIELYYESLELTLFPDELYQRRFRERFIQKYSDRKPDVIVTAGSASLNFIAELDKPFVRDTPIIFCSVLGEIPDRTSPDMHFTGVLGRVHPEETLNAALRLLPTTKHVAVVGGMGPFDVKWEAIAKRSFQKYESKLEFMYLTDLTMPVLLERLKRLPSDTIVYHTAITVDAAGRRFIDSAQSVPLVASAANAPVFVMDDVDFRAGTMGGDLVNWADDARVAAEMAVRVLNGEKPQDIPIVTSNNAYMFDWHALQRWGAKESNLPPGSIVLNRPQSFWQLYERYVLAAIFVFLVQVAAIFALLWQRARKLRVEADLRSSEQKFSKCFRQSPLVITISRTSDSRFIDVNESFERLLGWNRDEVINHTPLDVDLWVDADQRAAFREQLSSNGRVRDLEACLRRKDGQTLTALVSAELIELGGKTCTISVAKDVTARKQAELVLSTFSSRLIEAHEQERTRIARELHDDFSQRVALLAFGLGDAQETLSTSSNGADQKLEKLKETVRELGDDLHSLSHRLHSGTLDKLGLVSGLRAMCREFTGGQGIQIVFLSEDVPAHINPDVALCLYRIVQEALQNLKKHSGAEKAEVRLCKSNEKLFLTVCDDGKGFDTNEMSNQLGLGIGSMQGRARLLGGEFKIHSELGKGTRIEVWVPLLFDTTQVRS